MPPQSRTPLVICTLKPTEEEMGEFTEGKGCTHIFDGESIKQTSTNLDSRFNFGHVSYAKSKVEYQAVLNFSHL